MNQRSDQIRAIAPLISVLSRPGYPERWAIKRQNRNQPRFHRALNALSPCDPVSRDRLFPFGFLRSLAGNCFLNRSNLNSFPRKETIMYPMRFIMAAVVATGGLLLAADPVATKSADGKVTGVITLRGKPLTGKVTFHLDDQFVGSKVKDDGTYKVHRVTVGKYKVTLEGKFVPARFTSEDITPLTVEVKEGDNTFDFNLQ
jgi:hypothetical protein